MNDQYGNFYYQENQGTSVGQYLSKTFAWMFLGLLITFVTAILTAATGLYIPLVRSGLIFVLTILEVVLVIVFSARIQKISFGGAAVLLAAYSFINGLVFSCYFLAYGVGTLVFAFLAAALYFGIMAVYGYVTQRDLSSWGPRLFGGLVALLLISIVMLFMGGGMAEVIYCAAGLFLFMAYTAYDTQKIKAMYYATGGQGELASKMSLMGALQLYLDFINIFLFILRLLARARKN